MLEKELLKRMSRNGLTDPEDYSFAAAVIYVCAAEAVQWERAGAATRIPDMLINGADALSQKSMESQQQKTKELRVKMDRGAGR